MKKIDFGIFYLKKMIANAKTISGGVLKWFSLEIVFRNLFLIFNRGLGMV